MEGADFSYVVLVAKPEDLKPLEIAQALSAANKVPIQDSSIQSRRAWGIVGQGMTKDAASQLADCLKKVSIESVVLPSNLLEEVASPEPAASFAFLPGQIEVQLKGTTKEVVPVETVRLVAAACIKQTIVTTVKVKEGPSAAQKAVSIGLMMAGLPIPIGGKSQEVEKKKESTDLYFYLDLFARKPARRFRVDAQHFNFSCLRARMGYSIPQNFRTLVQELVRLCPQAHKNRGAQVLLDGAPVATMGYDAVEDLDRESRWRLTLDSLKNP